LAAELDDLAHGFGVEVVTDQDADLISPDFSSGSTATPEVGVVDHVIVEERGGVDELDEAPQLVVLRPRVAAEAGAEEQQQRPDALPPAVQNMGPDRVDESDARVEVFPDLMFHPIEFMAIGVPDIRHALDGRNRRTLRHAADGRAEQEKKSSELLLESVVSSTVSPEIRRLDRGFTLLLMWTSVDERNMPHE
jgi:hypothetical protein